MTFEAWAWLPALIALCVAAAWLDLTQRRIPNWLCGLTAFAGLTLATVLDGFSGLGSHALHTAVALLGGMALFALGGFGGGDAKFYAGVAAWFGLGDGVRLLLCVALGGLLLLIVWFGYRRIKGLPVRRTNDGPWDGLPYGVAIGVGAITAVVL